MQHNVRPMQYGSFVHSIVCDISGRLGKIPSVKIGNLIAPTHVSGVLLSVWDNILGPRMEHV